MRSVGNPALCALPDMRGAGTMPLKQFDAAFGGRDGNAADRSGLDRSSLQEQFANCSELLDQAILKLQALDTDRELTFETEPARFSVRSAALLAPLDQVGTHASECAAERRRGRLRVAHRDAQQRGGGFQRTVEIVALHRRQARTFAMVASSRSGLKGLTSQPVAP